MLYLNKNNIDKHHFFCRMILCLIRIEFPMEVQVLQIVNMGLFLLFATTVVGNNRNYGFNKIMTEKRLPKGF